MKKKLSRILFLNVILVAGITSCQNKDKVEEMASEYCDWALKEAQAKENGNREERRIADDKSDEIRKNAKTLSDEDFLRFKELTKDCKDH